jgi:hypothetical protein
MGFRESGRAGRVLLKVGETRRLRRDVVGGLRRELGVFGDWPGMLCDRRAELREGRRQDGRENWSHLALCLLALMIERDPCFDSRKTCVFRDGRG